MSASCTQRCPYLIETLQERAEHEAGAQSGPIVPALLIHRQLVRNCNEKQQAFVKRDCEAGFVKRADDLQLRRFSLAARMLMATLRRRKATSCGSAGRKKSADCLSSAAAAAS